MTCRPPQRAKKIIIIKFNQRQSCIFVETHAQHKATKYYGKCSHNILWNKKYNPSAHNFLSNKRKISCKLCATIKNIMLIYLEILLKKKDQDNFWTKFGNFNQSVSPVRFLIKHTLTPNTPLRWFILRLRAQNGISVKFLLEVYIIKIFF